jgi:hypothetical protein
MFLGPEPRKSTNLGDRPQTDPPPYSRRFRPSGRGRPQPHGPTAEPPADRGRRLGAGRPRHAQESASLPGQAQPGVVAPRAPVPHCEPADREVLRKANALQPQPHRAVRVLIFELRLQPQVDRERCEGVRRELRPRGGQFLSGAARSSTTSATRLDSRCRRPPRTRLRNTAWGLPGAPRRPRSRRPGAGAGADPRARTLVRPQAGLDRSSSRSSRRPSTVPTWSR